MKEMTGRGKRLGEKAEPLKNKLKLDDFDISLLICKIDEINIENIDLILLGSIHNLFKKLCTSKNMLKDIISNLYSRALRDIDFGQKFLIAFEELSHYEVEGFLVRTELLSYVQEDFKLKDFTAKSDPKKFLNVVMILGAVYQRIQIFGVPIIVLGIALIECFDLLLKGEEEELKVLTTQILINGKRISTTEELSQKYEKLKHNIRSTLINRNLNSTSKCWILLILEFMNNDLKPLCGIIRNFYYGHLGEEFKKLESRIQAESKTYENSFNSVGIKKGQSNFISELKNVEKIKEYNDNHKDLEKKISDLKVSKSNTSARKEENPGLYDTRKNNKKWQTGENLKKTDEAKGESNSGDPFVGHDDRFHKEENFYGIQTPRKPKSES